MKKGLLITLGVIAFIFLTLLLIPVLFKDQIRSAIEEEVSKTINATIVLDPEKVNLSLIKNFPNATISIDDFALIGKAEGFRGDTLYYAKSTKLVADIMSVISGDKIKIKGLLLDQPLILTKFTADGKMSWDIVIPSEEEEEQPVEEESSEFNIGIDKWEIRNGRIIYEDQSMPVYAELKGFDHIGGGDLTQEIFIMDTWTKVAKTYVVFEGVKYLDAAELELSVKMDMNYDKMIFKFLDNSFRVNDFVMGMDGEIAMPGDDINFDITYQARETSFKTLLSLVPAIYAKDFETIKTEGDLSFDGWVKGTMNDSLMPGYAVNLAVNDAMFQYPDLPTAVRNIAIDLHVLCEDGVIDNILVDLKKFHMEMGANPIDARLRLEGLEPANIDANIQATVNLEDITRIYPIDSIELKGLLALDVKATGVYSETSMPQVNALMSMKNGYVRSLAVAEPLEDIHFKATVLNADGSLEATRIHLENFNMKLQDEPFNMQAYVENLDNPKYDARLKGILDLGKLTRLYPLEDMTVSGRIVADIATKGVMSDIDAGNYLNTATSGTMEMKDIVYSSPDFPQGLKLTNASFALTPDKATIHSMKGYVGQSDIDVDGYVSNYMGYMFGAADSTIRGKMNFRSSIFDVNEWMTDEEEAVAETETVSDTGAVLVPKNIDFVLNASIKKVLYTNMTLENMTGDIIVKEGVARLQKLNFNTLGGFIVANGFYDSRDEKDLKFDMDFDLKELGIKEAYSTFNTVKSFAPIAGNIEGSFSTKMKLGGNLDNAMSPVMESLYGSGALNIVAATLQGGKVFKGIESVTKMANVLPLQLKDVLMQFEVNDGKLSVKPFDIKAGNTKMNIQGNQSLAGALDYLINMDVPAGAVGTQINSAIASLTGKPVANADRISLNLNVGGTSDNPKISLVGSSLTGGSGSVKETVKEAVKDKVKDELKNNEELNKAKAELEAKKKAEEERIRKEAEEKIKKEEERLKKEAENKAKEALKKLPKF